MAKLTLNILPTLKGWFFEKANIVTGWNETVSDEKVPSEKLVKTEIDNANTKHTTELADVKSELETEIATKVPKSAIKSTIAESLTDEELIGGQTLYAELKRLEEDIPDNIKHTDITDWDTATAGFEESSNKVTVIGDSASDSSYPSEKAVKTALGDAKTQADKDYAAKVHTHTHSDVSDWDSATSDFQLKSNLETSISTSDEKYPSSKAVQTGLDSKLNTSQKVTTVDNNSSDENVPSAKAVYDLYSTIPKWQVSVVASVSDLPATGVIGTIYLVKGDGKGSNTYDEYFWNDKAETPGYEKFGGIDMDLSSFVTMSDVVSYISDNGSLALSDDGELSLSIVDPVSA